MFCEAIRAKLMVNVGSEWMDHRKEMEIRKEMRIQPQSDPNLNLHIVVDLLFLIFS